MYISDGPYAIVFTSHNDQIMINLCGYFDEMREHCGKKQIFIDKLGGVMPR